MHRWGWNKASGAATRMIIIKRSTGACWWRSRRPNPLGPADQRPPTTCRLSLYKSATDLPVYPPNRTSIPYVWEWNVQIPVVFRKTCSPSFVDKHLVKKSGYAIRGDTDTSRQARGQAGGPTERCLIQSLPWSAEIDIATSFDLLKLYISIQGSAFSAMYRLIKSSKR